MSYLPTAPARFAEQAVDGFAASHPRHVKRVDGGVIRLSPMTPGQVGVVVGGGSGHYPAFAGLVQFKTEGGSDLIFSSRQVVPPGHAGAPRPDNPSSVHQRANLPDRSTWRQRPSRR